MHTDTTHTIEAQEEQMMQMQMVAQAVINSTRMQDLVQRSDQISLYATRQTDTTWELCFIAENPYSRDYQTIVVDVSTVEPHLKGDGHPKRQGITKKAGWKRVLKGTETPRRKRKTAYENLMEELKEGN